MRSAAGKVGARSLGPFAVVLLALSAVVGASAQTARVAGELTNFGSTLTNAAGIALDASKNAYVVTTGSGSAVYKESFNSSTGVYTETQLFTVAVGTSPGITVDAAGGDIFVATGTNHTVVEYAGSGTSYSLTNTFGGFTGTPAVAVDATDNVYIADGGSGILYKETYSGTAYSQAQIVMGLGTPSAIAIDSSGNLFVATAANLFYKVAGSGTTYTKTQLTVTGVTNVTDLAADASDNLFLVSSSGEVSEATPSGSTTYTEKPYYQFAASGIALDSLDDVYLVSGTQTVGTLLTVGNGYLNFGSVGPGTPPTMTVAFTLTSGATTLGTPTVVTQGLAGYDYTLGTGSTCTGLAVTSGNSCTVVVQFAPRSSGSRLGAVNLLAGGRSIASSFLGGVGFAPLAAYQSVTLLNTIACPSSCSASLPNGLSNGRGITVDPAGNVWVANSTAYQILKFPAGSQTPVTFSTVTSNGNCSPVGTAIDGEGNVFYTCNAETNMYELVAGAGTPVAIPVGYSTDDHLSVDAAGNLYPTSYQPGNYFLKVAAGTHAVSVIATAPTGARFVAAVTDAAGNTFAPDYANDILYELPAGSNTLTTLYSGSPLQAPHAIAEDAAGSLYVTTTVPNTTGNGNSPLLRFTAGNYTATPASLSVPGGDSLYITPDGDFYTVYSNSTLAVYTRTIFSLSYANTAVGQTSAPQTVTLENDGTAPLTISPPSTGTNPSVSVNFAYDPSSTCPELSTGSAAIILNAGASCTQIVEFTPQQVGSISGSLITTDNSANVSGSKQTIDVSGTATQGTPTVSVASVSGTLGQSVTLSATVSGGGVAPTGAVSFVVGSGSSVAAICTGGTNSETCTATYSTSTGLVSGANTITASFAADSNYLASSGTGTLTLANAVTTSSVTSPAPHSSTYGTSVTFTATVSSGYGTPSGTVTFYDGATLLTTASLNGSGQATFTTSTLLAGTHSITVAYGGSGTYATSTSSPALSQIVTQAPATSNDTASGTGTYGATPTAVTVTIPYVGAVAPTGAITITDTHSNTVTIAASTCTAASGRLTCTANLPTANEPVGSNSLTVGQVADSNYNASTGTGTVTIGKAVAATSDTATGTGTYGAATTSVTVNIPYPGVVAPTGGITVTDTLGNTVTVAASVCTAASNRLTCTANLPTANEPLGSNAISVGQASDSNYNASTGSGTVTIGKALATTTDTATGAGTYGAGTTPVTVTIPYAGTVAPSGAITLTDGFSNTATVAATTCTAASARLTCTVNLPTANEPVGSNPLTVAQAADSNYNGSTGTGTVTIGKAAAATNDTATGTGTYGAATSPVTITIPYVGAVAPTGAITVADTHSNTVTIAASTCTAAGGKLTCTANLPTSNEPVGGNSVTVSQAADNNYNTSSGSGTVTIGKAAATTTDTAIGAGTYGAATTPVTITIPYGGSVAPTGAITLTDGFSNTVTVAASTCTAASSKLTCAANLPTANEPVGGNPVNVSQAADTNYSGSTGTGTVTIGKAAATTTDTATGTGTYGAATTPVIVTIPFVGTTAPTGAITVTDTHSNSVTIAASSCTASGGALTCTGNLPTANEPIGGNSVTVAQAADNNYAGSTGSGTVTIGKAAATASDTATGSGTYGVATTPVTITIPYSGATAPTGAITLSDGFTNTVTIAASTCTASGGKLTCAANLPTANEPVGGNPVTVSQAADTNYSGSTGTGTVTIGKAAATASDSAVGTGTYGAATTPVTVTIPYAGATAPTGAITLSDTHSNTVTLAASTCTVSGGRLTCTASLPTANEPVGGNAVSVSQAADNNYSGSTGTGTVTIGKAAATTTDTATGTGIYGAATTAVTVTIPYAGIVAPAGAITVSDAFSNTVTIAATTCTASSNRLTCTANLPTANEPVGGNTVSVSQAADTNYTGSTGTGTVTIGKVAATTTDTVTGAGTYGAATTPVVVNIPYAGTTAPTGAITVTDTFSNTVTIAASVCTASGGRLTCAANLPTANEPVGANPASVSQAADSNYSGSTGTGTITIAKAAATTGDTATGTGTYGAATTAVTITIPYVGPTAPTGAITLTDTHTNTVTIAASTCTATASKLTCTANLPTANEPVGANTVAVAQAADSNYSGSTGSGTVTIGKAAATTNDTATGTGTYGSATTPVSVTIPYAGQTAPAGAIMVADTHGNTVTVQASACTPSSGDLNCTANLPTANDPAGPNTVTVSQAADSNYGGSSGSGTVTLGKAALTTGDTATGTGTYGAASTPIAITIPYAGLASPTGAITVADTHGNTVTVQASACTASVGVLSCGATLATANEPVGSNTLTVTQAGDGNYTGSTGSGAVTIGKATGTNTDTVTGSGIYGAATSSVTVTIPYAGTVAPTGAITVSDTLSNNVAIQPSTCTAAAGRLTCTANLPTANEPVGANSLTVTEAPDTNYSGSTGSGTNMIGKAAATTGDTASGTGTYGAATTAVTATIPFAGPTAPTGAITISDSLHNTITVQATACSASGKNLICVASLPTANEPVGSNPVSVVQAADPSYSGSTGSGTITINKAAASSADTASGTGVYGALSTPVTISIPYTGVTAPTGAITLTDTHSNTVTVQASTCTASAGMLTCSTNLATANEPIGANTVSVSQAADTNYSGSTGTGTITISKAGATGTDTASGTGTYGAATTSVKVTIPYAGTSAPTGAITLSDTHNETVTFQASTCTAAAGVLTCTATLPTVSESAGSNPVTVAQVGDANYSGSTGSGYVTLNKAAGGSGDSANGSGTYGAPTTAVTVTIPYSGASAPTGAITVTDSHNNTASIAASTCSTAANALTCVVTLPTANEPVGSNPVSVSQTADANYTVSTGSGTITIGKAPVTANDTVNGSGTYGAATTPVVVTIPYIGTAPPSGAITVSDTLGNTVTVPASGCTASNGVLTCTANLPTANEPTGSNALTVTQASDSNYSGSTGSGTLTMNPAGARVDDSVSGSGSFGSPATAITVLIPYSGSAPSGVISVADTFGNAITIAASTCQATAGALVCPASLPTANEPVGNNPAVVAQAADANHSASTGSGTITINKAPASIADKVTGSGTYGAATTPVTVTIPFAGATAPTGAVSVTDTLGNTASLPASACSTAGQTLTCIVNLPTANEPLGANQANVAQAADANYSGTTGSGTITIILSTVSPIGSTSAGVQNVTINQGTASTLLTATLAFSGANPPTGAVSFTVASGTPVAATCTTGATQEICTAQYPTGSLQVGIYTITANEAADANYIAGSATGTLTVAGGAVSPILDTVSNVGNVLITAGTQNATLSASITFNGPVPTGGLTFNIPGGNPLSATCTSGPSPLTCTASYPTASLAVGTYVITATEAADSTYAQGAATALLTVEANTSVPVSPILTTGSNVSSVLVPYGTSSAALTATIQYSGPAPTGAVTFTVNDGTGVIVPATCTPGPSPLTCTATWSTAALGIGSYRIEVDEAADANYPAGSAIGTLTVTKVAAGTNDNVSGTGTYGSATTPITVTIPYVGSTTPTGNITVSDTLGNTVTIPASGCTANSGLLTCVGNLPSTNVPVGSDAAIVTQAADSVYAASTGSGTITINKAAATTSDTVTGTGTYGAATTDVTVTIPYAGTVAPTGAVTVTDSLGNTVTVQASTCSASSGTLTCNANLPTANEPLGSNTLTVAQAADANYSGSTGTGISTINKAGPTSNDAANGTGTYGAPSTPVTVTIPYVGSAAPAGAITLADTHNNTVTVQASSCTAAGGLLTCNTTLPTANEPVGANPVTVTQAADANYSGSTGAGIVTINKTPVTSTDTVTGTSNYGSSTTTVTVTIPYTGAVPPSGAITVTDSHGNTVTVPASSCTAAAGVLTCTASLPTSNVTVGADTLTVSQAADGNYSGSTGSGAATINKAPATTTDTATGTGTYGATSSTVTITIPYAGTTAPTGAVSVTDGFGNTATVPGTSCTAANGALTCTATLATANEPLGNNPVAVTQIGDANYAGSTGTGTVTIKKALAGNDTASGTGTYGAPTTPITVTIPYSGTTAPSGAITVTDTHGNNVTVSNCTAAANTLSCTANLPTANEPVGANSVTVNQAADASHNASTGPGTVTVNKAPLTSTDTLTGTGTYGSSTTLVTVTIPFSGVAAPTGAITVSDSLGNTVTVPASSCTAAGGILTCTVTLPTANEPVGSNQLTVSQAPDANYSGSTGTGSATINKAGAATDTLSGTGTYGAPTTPVTVNIPFEGTTAPTGAITITDTHSNTVTVQASSCSASRSSLTCTANLPTANEPAGPNTATVTQAADSVFAASTGTGTITINKAPATTGDTATGSGKYGAATTAVTVTIPYAGVAAPTGAITVTDTLGNTVTVAASSCTAAAGVLTCTANLPTANEPVGVNNITVSQAADANYSGSTGTGSVTLGKTTPTLTAPTISPMNAVFGTSVTITQTVPSAETGTVTFMSGTTVLGTATITNGVATLTTSALPQGTDSITATANGDANFSAATSPAVTDTVNSGTVTVALSSSQPTTTFGSAVTFTAAISTTPSGAIAGTVTFSDGTTVLGTAPVSNGTATINTSSLNVGNHTITASFTPASTSTLSAGTSAPLQQVVQPAAPSIALTSSQNPAIVQQSITFSATVPADPGGTAPTGTVTFYDGTTVLGTAPLNSSGVATFNTSALKGGAHTITATYAGDANYAPVTSTAIAQKVSDFGIGNTTPTISVDPGGAGAFNITINPANGVAFASPVVLSVTGLPSGATPSFSAGTVTPGTAGTTSTMTVQTLAKTLTAMEHHQHVKSLEAAAAWACLFPLLGLRRIRRRLPKALLMLAVFVGSFGVIAPLTGCGGGYFGPAPASYTLTVTGTSGTLQRSTTVTLNMR